MMTSNDTVTVLLCGVGGQGTILAADLLAHAALESGYDAKVSEIHGMSQRGGAVTTVVRFGRAGVQSMVSDPGCADCVVSFETTEALRNLPNVREGGYLLVADESSRFPCSSGALPCPSMRARRWPLRAPRSSRPETSPSAWARRSR